MRFLDVLSGRRRITKGWVVSTLAAVGLGIFAAVAFPRSREREQAWHAELRRFMGERPSGARVFVAVGQETPARWREVNGLSGDELTSAGQPPVRVSATTAFVVAYAGGGVLAAHGLRAGDLPEGVNLLEPAAETTDDTFPEADARRHSCVQVTFGPRRPSPTRGAVFETRVTNHCDVPVRITHFGAYVRDEGVWKLNTITNGFFTAQHFTEWYGAPGDGWLPPGASAADRENYGSGGALWVYFFERKDGTKGRAIGRGPR